MKPPNHSRLDPVRFQTLLDAQPHWTDNIFFADCARNFSCEAQTFLLLLGGSAIFQWISPSELGEFSKGRCLEIPRARLLRAKAVLVFRVLLA